MACADRLLLSVRSTRRDATRRDAAALRIRVNAITRFPRPAAATGRLRDECSCAGRRRERGYA
jgi:hypothetical protein